MILNEDARKWSSIIKEELHVEDPSKLNWMSQYARNHEIYEGLQSGSVEGGIYTTPLNTVGMGNPMMPQGTGFNTTNGSGIGNTGADFHAHNYGVGSGDIPMSTLNMSLEIAAMTIGLELVPVIPSNGPWAMLQYMDFPYAGGKLGRINETSLDGKGKDGENKPIYIKLTEAVDVLRQIHEHDIKNGDKVELVSKDADGKDLKLNGTYIGKSRIDNGLLIKVKDCGDEKTSIADVVSGKNATLSVGDPSNAKSLQGHALTSPHASLVSGAADHVQEFSNFFGDGEGNGSDDPMTRAQNETGVGNTIGARFFTKMVQMGSYEVTGSVTRQQLQDMPLYGIDVVGKVLEAMQNEISQAINNRILDRAFKLGVTNALTQKTYQKVDLNLYLTGAAGAPTKDLKDFTAASKFIGIDGKNASTNWGPIVNATKNTSAENVYTHQRRIMSRCLAATNLIANVSRFGRANWIVTNTQILSALQDCAGFVIAPMVNTLTQDNSQSIYFAGSIAGLNVYVDPYMTWDDTRICVGRKSDGSTPGIVFMPYLLSDTVQITAEGTMAPKLLVNSRFAIVDCGFHPEQNYFTFMVDTDEGMII